MKVVLVARDIAPSNAFKMVVAEFLGNSWLPSHTSVLVKGAELFVGSGKPLKATEDEIAAAVKSADVVLVGISSSAELAKEELVACKVAKEASVPYGLYADTFGCAVNRNWFDHVRAEASFVFVLNGKEAEEARKVFSKAKVVASGNPTWDDFFYPKLTREESRAKLGIKDDEVFVLCPGGKSLAINIQHWGFVIEALDFMNGSEYAPRKWNVIFSRHPGDQSAPDAYAELVKFSDIQAKVVAPDEMKTSDMIPGMDVMVSCCSTVEIEAVCQRKPVISYIPHTGLVRMRTTMGDKWEPVEQGVVISSTPGCTFDLADSIDDLLTLDVWNNSFVRSKQEALYPKPTEKGVALRAIIGTLQEFAKGRK